jgi:hypothetical protein
VRTSTPGFATYDRMRLRFARVAANKATNLA